MRHPSCLLTVLGLTLVLLTSPALADVAIVQDSCRAQGVELTIYFSIVNFNTPTNVCGLHLIPRNPPPLPGCIIIDGEGPPGWFCSPRGDGGADWGAQAPSGCFGPGQVRRGYNFVLDPKFCCYDAQFTGPAGTVIFQQEACFTCGQPVGVEPAPWGRVKRIYR